MHPHSPLLSWLDHLWVLYPAQNVLVIGAGNGTSPWTDALQRWQAPSATLVEADEAQFLQLQHSPAAREGWHLRKQVIASQTGSATFYTASNPAESGLLEPEGLRALWPNLKTRQKTARQAISLSELLAATEPGANWLIIDCLTADDLLASTAEGLAQLDVIVTRTRLPLNDTEADRSGTPTLTAIQQTLEAQGFTQAATQQARNPGIAHALYVRNHIVRIRQLTEQWQQVTLAAETESTRSREAGRLAEAQAKEAQQHIQALQVEIATLNGALEAKSALQAAEISTLNNAIQAQTATKAQALNQVQELQAEIAKLKQAQEARDVAHASELTDNATKLQHSVQAEAAAKAQALNQLQALQAEIAKLKQTEKEKIAIQAEELAAKISATVKQVDIAKLQSADLQKQLNRAMGKVAALQLEKQSLQSARHARDVAPPEVHAPFEPSLISQFDLGQAWAANTVNTVIFRHHAILTHQELQFTAFYVDERTLRFICRRLSDDHITKFDLAGDYNLRDAHNSISLGIDRKGFLHVCFDHHASKLRYRRSLQPLQIEGWTDDQPMTGRHEERVTYPTFILPRAEHPLTLLYRDGTHNSGSARLKYYDEATELWRDKTTPILSGADQKPWTSNAYWNHPAVGSDGSLHLSFVWRTGVLGDEQRVNNINIGHAWSPDNGHHWYTLQGLPYQTPITPSIAETIWPVAPGSNLINQCSMALDRFNRPHIAYYSNDVEGVPQYQHLWYDGKTWHQQLISQRTQPFLLQGGGTLQIPISRPEIVLDEHDHAYVIYRGDITSNRLAVQRLLAPHYISTGEAAQPLWPEDIGFSEPVIDRARWTAEKRLTLLVQHNQQPNGDLNHDGLQTPVHLVDVQFHR